MYESDKPNMKTCSSWSCLSFAVPWRVLVYLFAFFFVIIYTSLFVVSLVQNINCINAYDIGDQDLDDCVLFRVDSTGKKTTASDHIVYIIITTLAWISSLASLVVLWLVDLQSQTNGFIRIIVELCKSQMWMDFGFYLIGVAFSFHGGDFDQEFPSAGGSKLWEYIPFSIGNVLLVMGDISTVLWSNVICFLFVRIARNGEALNVTHELPSVSRAITIVGLVMGLIEAFVCCEDIFLVEEGCPMVRVRASISACGILVNIVACLYVNHCVRSLPDSGRKSAIQQLFSRMLFYPAWNAFCRLGYMVAGFETGALPLLFSNFKRPIDYVSVSVWCIWLPQGLGVALFYLYTHPRETHYLVNVLLCKVGYHLLPDDIRAALSPCLKKYLRGPSYQHLRCPGRCCVVPEDDVDADYQTEAPEASLGGETENPIVKEVSVERDTKKGAVRDSFVRPSRVSAANGAVTRESLIASGANTFASRPRGQSEGVVRVTEEWFGPTTIQEEEVLCAEILPKTGDSVKDEHMSESQL